MEFGASGIFFVEAYTFEGTTYHVGERLHRQPDKRFGAEYADVVSIKVSAPSHVYGLQTKETDYGDAGEYVKRHVARITLKRYNADGVCLDDNLVLYPSQIEKFLANGGNNVKDKRASAK